MEIGLNINPDRDGIENAAQIPSSEWRTFVFGNCLVTCSLLEEFLPQRYVFLVYLGYVWVQMKALIKPDLSLAVIVQLGNV